MTTEAARAIEAILMVAQEPVDPHLLAQLLEVAPAVVDATCAELEAGYEEQGRGFAIVKVAGGYRFQSRADLAPYVERFALEGQSARLSNAALETLAIVAYKQPLSRAQVAAIRGVNVDGVMRTLQQRGYIAEVGRDAGPGQATLFGTTDEFLVRMGLDRIEDLPDIAALFPSADVLEALEKTLRAERPAEEGTLPLDGSAAAEEGTAGDAGTPAGEGAAAGPTPDLAAPVAPPVATPDEVRAIDDAPAPEPPAWAVDPPVDVDGDGQPDHPASP
jgi:segregation and condensation protein B